MQSGLRIFPEQASTIAEKVDPLYLFLVGLTVFFTLLIGFLVVFFSIKYRRRSDSERPAAVHGALSLEILWTVIPLGIVLVIFFWSAKVFFMISRPPDDSMQVYVTGKQWMWKIQHKEGPREINELHVPLGQSVKLTMTSEDVIHSFYVPAFRIKMDVLPRRYTTTWFKATKPGVYHLFCAEYCGTKHSGMIGQIIVMQPADFQNWLSGGADSSTLAEKGQKLFQDLACTNCHHTDSSGRGPVLTGIFGKTMQLTSGEKVKVDEVFLRESIVNPGAKVVAGYEAIMPTFQGLVTEEQLLALIEYIKSTGQQQEPGQTAPAKKGTVKQASAK